MILCVLESSHWASAIGICFGLVVSCNAGSQYSGLSRRPQRLVYCTLWLRTVSDDDKLGSMVYLGATVVHHDYFRLLRPGHEKVSTLALLEYLC